MATYNPSNFTASNKPFGVQGLPSDARQWFRGDDGTIRPFMSVEEAIGYFNTPLKRRGKFPILVNSGGTLSSDGQVTGGTFTEYWWRDGEENSQLIPKGSATDFTAEDRAKLNSLTSLFVGRYSSLSALQAAKPFNVPDGSYAFVDTTGKEVNQYIWDMTDANWVLVTGADDGFSNDGSAEIVDLVEGFEPGMSLNMETGQINPDPNYHLSKGFIRVYPGQKVKVSQRVGGYIALGGPTGLAGYSAPNDRAFVSQKDIHDIPVGNLWGLDRANLKYGTALTVRTTFESEEVTIPPGVYYIKGSSAIVDGIAISIMGSNKSIHDLYETKADKLDVDLIMSTRQDVSKKDAFVNGKRWEYLANPPKGDFVTLAGRASTGYQPVFPDKDYTINGITNFLVVFNSAGVAIKYFQSPAGDTGMDADGVLRIDSTTYNNSTKELTFRTPKDAAFIVANSHLDVQINSQAAFDSWKDSVKMYAYIRGDKINQSLLPDAAKVTTVDENVTFYAGKRINLTTLQGLYYKKLFSISTGNQQGLSYSRGKVFLGFDIGGGNARIEVWDYNKKTLIKSASSLAVGHAAEMKYNPNDGKLYVANGGYGSPSHVYAISIDAEFPAITRDYDLGSLGDSTMVAIDTSTNTMWVSSAVIAGNGDHIFTAINITTGGIIAGSQFILPYMGVPNGIAFNNGRIFFCYGVDNTAIAVINPATKTKENTVVINGTGEPEGLDVVDDEDKPYFIFGIRNLGVHALYSVGASIGGGSDGDFQPKEAGKGLSEANFSAAEKTKLSNIATGATANSTDAQLKDRANHTGSQPISSITDLQNQLDNKQPTELGKGLSQENYTTSEKSKLANIDAYFVGRYVSLANLQTAHPTSTGGKYAIVDAPDADAVMYIWDVTESSWVLSAVGDGSGGAVTSVNGQVGSVVISMADLGLHNDFSDAEKLKLQNVAANATANSSDAQLKDRANHTGSQAQNTITGLVDALAAKQPTETGKGLSQENYTTTEKTKLAGMPDPTTLANTAYEVDIKGTLGSGKVSADTGAFASDANHDLTGFLAVTPGQRLRVTFSSGTFNTIAPFVGTGLNGYSAATYTSYVGTILSASTYNVANGTNLQDPVSFVDTVITIPAGVNFIKVPNYKPNGLTMKVMGLQNTGTPKSSIDQLYQRLLDLVSNGTGGGGGKSANDFTDAYKDKLDTIRTPVVSWDDGGQIWTHQTTGLKYRGVLKNDPPELVWIPLATSLRSFIDYPVGYALDIDKMGNTAYNRIIQEAGILTPENGFLPLHLQNGLNTGFTTFVPGAGSLKYNWTEADAICTQAQSKGIKVYACHLTWHADGQIPTFLINQIAADPTNAKAIATSYLNEYIPTAMNHFETNFPGIVIAWNLTNEAINASKSGITGGTIKPCKWNDWFPVFDDFVEVCARAAYSSNSTAKLFMNDYDLETSNASQGDRYRLAMANLAAKNIVVGGRQVKIDGIGFQFHTVVGQDLNAARLKMKAFADAGYKVAITELDATIEGPEYTQAMAEEQAQFFYDVFINYERAVPQAQRYGVMFWTVTDRHYIKNLGKNPPGSATNPVTSYPSLYDYYGNKKLAYERLLTIPGRASTTADVHQDFIATGTLTNITGTYTDGLTPLPWIEEGYTGGDVGINSVGLRAAQNSTNSITHEVVDYPKTTTRYVEARLAAIASPGNRCTYLLVRCSDTSNYVALQATNTDPKWQLVKRVSGIDTVLYVTSVVPAAGDTVKVVCDGPLYTIYINNNMVGSVSDTANVAQTKLGFRLRGYNDKFTTWEYITADSKIS